MRAILIGLMGCIALGAHTQILQSQLNQNRLSFHFSTQFGKMHSRLLEGELSDYQSKIRPGYFLGFNYMFALQKERFIELGMDYGIQQLDYRFRQELQGVPDETYMESYFPSKHDMLELNLSFSKSFYLSKQHFHHLSVGFSYRALVSRNDFYTGGYTKDLIMNQDTLELGKMDFESHYFLGHLPALRLAYQFGRLKRDGDMITAALLFNYSMSEIVSGYMQVSSEYAAGSARVRYNYKGSYFGIQLSYWLNKNKIEP